MRSVVPGRHRKVLPATDKGGEDDGTAAVVPQAKRSKRGPAPSDSKQVSVPPAPPPLAEYAAAALKEFPMLSDSELRAEFEELPFVPDGKTSTFALREANEDKNRYCDISGVTLGGPENKSANVVSNTRAQSRPTDVPRGFSGSAHRVLHLRPAALVQPSIRRHPCPTQGEGQREPG